MIIHDLTIAAIQNKNGDVEEEESDGEESSKYTSVPYFVTI